MDSVLNNLPILQVLIPFLAAPMCVVIGRSDFAWLLALFSSGAALIISILLLNRVSDGEVISYHIGGWAPPLGIEYVVDTANAFLLVLVSAVSFFVLLYSLKQLKHELDEDKHTLFYTCFLLCLTGLLGVLITGDIFNVFVFLEISALSTYVLVAQGASRDRRALTGAFNYLIMGTVGATFFVIGVGFLYMETGSLNMNDISQRLINGEPNKTIKAAYAFIVIGMGLKLAMFPLHLWLPNAYTYAPSVVTSFLAATATKVSLYVLIRFTFSVFDPESNFIVEIFKFLILPLAFVAMFWMSLVAIFQNDIKKMLAYSSVAQIGYMLLGLGLLSSTGLQATLVNVFNHGITKATLFLALGVFFIKYKSSFFDNLSGAGKTMPITSAAFVVGGLSLVGFPGTAGFVSKWLLVEAALDNGTYGIAFLVILSSLFSVVYVWNVIENLYFGKQKITVAKEEVSYVILVPVWCLALACIFFGLNTELTLYFSEIAADSLLKK